MPNYQGKLDGLCGPYAIVNAFEHCGINSHKEIFEAACGSLPSKRWPNVLWSGTTFRDLQKMIKICIEAEGLDEFIRIKYPFSRNIPKSNNEYWKRFDELFRAHVESCCAIIGITRPFAHWIVAYRETATRISFIDAHPTKPKLIKNRSMLYAGSRNGHPKKWLIERNELILFERI